MKNQTQKTETYTLCLAALLQDIGKIQQYFDIELSKKDNQLLHPELSAEFIKGMHLPDEVYR